MIRKAKLSDAEAIKRIIGIHAKKGKMLPRPIYEIYEAIRDFYIAEESGKVVGCMAIHIYGKEYKPGRAGEDVLGEIRSLAVLPEKQGQGIGRELVGRAIEDVKELGVTKVFTLTYVADFFEKLGFKKIGNPELPQKIWSDCKGCVKFPDECDETAMAVDV